jgi:uncharacterized protein YfaT (DUF1175 family)
MAALDRRQFCTAALALFAAAQGQALMAGTLDSASHPQPLLPHLNAAQSQAFRDWMVCVVRQQLEQGPTPLWQQHDCAGLVRFAVGSALREHDDKWLHAISLAGRRLPPPLALNPAQQQLRNSWQQASGKKTAWVGALELVQANTRFLARDPLVAQSGDLFFFDQGDDQHLMIWMGNYLAYHTGHSTPQDNGLRAYDLSQMQAWRDTRWKPQADNPNFAGVYRLAFLA